MKVGVLGAGQLGRMLALAGIPLGQEFRFFDPAPDSPASRLGAQTAAGYDDADALQQFTDGLDVVTYEFENVPVETARTLAQRVLVYPPAEALERSQDRLVEKEFFRGVSIPTAPFAKVDSREELDAAVAKLGLPAILKTRRMGYDGKGQAVLRTEVESEQAWQMLDAQSLILEGFVPFERELSLLSVRGRNGEIVFYPLVENHHREGILRVSLAPAFETENPLQSQAEEYAKRILQATNYVGVLAIEFFERDGQLIANEMAPRVHNSGHWTIEGAETSQFANHIRAICGLPLGSGEVREPCAMVNIIGEPPDSSAVLRLPRTALHLYGKSARPGRKLGHITVFADDSASLAEKVETVKALLPAP